MPHLPYPAIRVVMGRRTEEIKKKQQKNPYRSPALVVMIDRCVCWLMIEWLQQEKETISRQPEKSQQQKNRSTNTSAIIRIHSPTDQPNNKPRNTRQARLRQQQQPTKQKITTKNNVHHFTRSGESGICITARTHTCEGSNARVNARALNNTVHLIYLHIMKPFANI